MESEKTVFAFKLAEKKRNDAGARDGKWKARDGLSVAGCTDPTGDGDFRYWFNYAGVGHDAGDWC